VAAGAAGCVEGDADREPVEDLPDDGLLEVEQLVSRLVVERGPLCVPLLDRHRRRVDALAPPIRVEEAAYLCEAGEHELSVVLACECAEQGHPLEPEEIGKRVLVDNRTAHAGD
jgi:hypothetical protein